MKAFVRISKIMMVAAIAAVAFVACNNSNKVTEAELALEQTKTEMTAQLEAALEALDIEITGIEATIEVAEEEAKAGLEETKAELLAKRTALAQLLLEVAEATEETVSAIQEKLETVMTNDEVNSVEEVEESEEQ